MTIRVTHVITGLERGGAEGMLVRLLGALNRERFDQAVVSLTTTGIHGTAITAAGVPLVSLGMQGATSAPTAVRALARVLRAQRPHVVQTWLYHSDLVGLLAARVAGVAAVAWNVRCAALQAGDVPRSTRWLTRMLATISRWPEAVVFNSEAGRQAHAALGYRPRQAEVIPNGFDLNEWRPDPAGRRALRAELGVDDETFVVGMVARFHRMKDQTTFLAAAAQVAGRMATPVRFVLVGRDHDWHNAALTADIDRHGLRSRVSLLGERQDVPRIMTGLDCLASTSTSEGFPNVLGEAMACGVPCLATDAGDSRLIVGDTGVIVPVGAVQAVADGIEQLARATTAERERRAVHARNRITSHFALDQIAARYAGLYAGLAERARARAQGDLAA